MYAIATITEMQVSYKCIYTHTFQVTLAACEQSKFREWENLETRHFRGAKSTTTKKNHTKRSEMFLHVGHAYNLFPFQMARWRDFGACVFCHTALRYFIDPPGLTHKTPAPHPKLSSAKASG